MADTLLSTPFTDRILLAVHVGVASGVFEVVKSVNSSLADNTAAVNADMTVVGGSLLYTSVTWRGKALNTFRSDGASYINFGANRPFIPNANDFAGGIAALYIGQQEAGSSAFLKSAGGALMPYPGLLGTNPAWKGSGSTFYALDGSTVSAGALISSLLRHKSSDTANNEMALGFTASAMVDSAYGGNGNGDSLGNDSFERLLTNGFGQFWPWQTGWYIVIKNDYAGSTQADRWAALLADVQVVEADPNVQLLDLPAGGSLAATLVGGLTAGRLTRGI